MISRRNIRVKVMQTLYTIHTQGMTEKPADAMRILQKHFEQTRQLFVYLIYLITEVARYAETDSRLRSSKHLPTDQDRNVNIKLTGNELVGRIVDDPLFKEAYQRDKPNLVANGELVRRLYQELAETDTYKTYIGDTLRDRKSEKDILLFILSDLMLPSESFDAHMEEIFSNWNDDGEMIIQLVAAYLAKPVSANFQELISKEKWDFAKDLLQAVLDKREMTKDLIKPKLRNWDADRIAILDMILMEMGICEFLFFETIPPKVTINEYIDLAKEYSTPQSGQFVNGLLDNIHKDLVLENKMHKVNFNPS
jgi:N utilization substance protein B